MRKTIADHRIIGRTKQPRQQQLLLLLLLLLLLQRKELYGARSAL